jgi:hypothetical protein
MAHVVSVLKNFKIIDKEDVEKGKGVYQVILDMNAMTKLEEKNNNLFSDIEEALRKKVAPKHSSKPGG